MQSVPVSNNNNLHSMEFKGVTFRGESPVDDGLAARLPEELQDFYRGSNGIIAYNGGLQIRSCTNDSHWNSLGYYWLGEGALHAHYPNLLSSDIPFGQDCVGDQFFLRDESVWLLSAETGDVIDMEASLFEFFDNCIEDPVEYLAMEPLVHHLDMEGALAPGMLVHVVPALSLELPEDTPYHIDSLRVDERLSWLLECFQSQGDS